MRCVAFLQSSAGIVGGIIYYVMLICARCVTILAHTDIKKATTVQT
jgi:hypothetical protein